MANQRVKNPVISETLGKVLLYKCMTCYKPIEGFYARFGNTGTCSRMCMLVENKKPKYPGHEESDFLKRFNLE